ncbi:MAG: hypothetical protein COV52_05785 [Gammaproteobacteria bacterium CG11_big_fil_rev_8_21_14_0_20_46_22]|nr:MAG: hypothetical protein COW05_07875 [Gammaproteobacteria bacterium CG12_big_fil_rev_8_21_14_0_65_46_12]PIR11016.1 MAG: hypothetical protein COV52_05785 [Gammaproteobacteria bacterium CG11_big_fil_rev_8_21_14_0_20_46_22]
MSTAYHVIKDPVHGSMQFTDQENQWIKPFIDSPSFQRLRHIKQLGMADWIFPGAVHTRFNHGLGCSYVANQIANKLGLSDSDRQLVTIAGLLHDVGHGPFSHAFEYIFKHQWIKHEDWTPLFLNDYLLPDFLEKFNERNPSLPLSESRFSIIKNLIMHKESHHKLLADIVSSQMDADRLDYLLRDSHFCGVKYGHYDLRWLLHCLTIVESQEGQRLGVSQKGIGAVEQYLMARRLMLRNVYLNGKKHAAEFQLSLFLSHLAKAVDDKALIGPFAERSLIKFLVKVREFNHNVSEHNLETLRSQFLQGQYGLYKKLCDYDVFAMIRHFSSLDNDIPLVQIAKRLQHRQLPKIVMLDHDKLERAKELIETLKVEPWRLRLLELPHEAYQQDKDPILVMDKHGATRHLEEDSLIISGLSNRKESLLMLCIDASLFDHKKVKPFF